MIRLARNPANYIAFNLGIDSEGCGWPTLPDNQRVRRAISDDLYRIAERFEFADRKIRVGVNAGRSELTGSHTSRANLVLRSPRIVFDVVRGDRSLRGNQEDRQDQVGNEARIVAEPTHWRTLAPCEGYVKTNAVAGC
jgi:hypothetical protein